MAAPTTTQEIHLLLSNVKASILSNGAPQTEIKGGFLYQEKIVVADGEISNAFLIPQGQISDIAYSYQTAPTKIYATLSSKADIEAGTADWQEVPSNGDMSPATNAVYIDNSGGLSSTTVTLNVRMIGG